jgi:hypothetical protein
MSSRWLSSTNPGIRSIAPEVNASFLPSGDHFGVRFPNRTNSPEAFAEATVVAPVAIVRTKMSLPELLSPAMMLSAVES